ncbi:hypothetical protein PQX77_017215 [Marasmius sp. AFHP31]|nr:hypothetical protein PQX77_017215 [Marasmius sp. AFHP31]
MSTQATANTTLEALLTCLVDQQQSQQAQLDAIKDTFKANKGEGAIIAKPAVFKGNADDVARFLPMFRNWATEQKALRIKAGQGVAPEDVGKLDHRRTIQSALSFCEGGKAGCWAANYLKQINTSMTNENAAFPFEGKWETFEKQFKVCFGSANEKADAIRELEQMKQGNKAVTLYFQDFRDAGAKTGLSDANLMIRFRSRLNPEAKKLLVMMDLAQGDPSDLDDLEDRLCRAERALEAEGMSTQATANTTLEALLTCLVDQQQSQQAQLDAIKDTFKANKGEGAIIAKPAVFKGNADDVARFLPMFRNWATEQKALRIKAGQGVAPEDVGKLDHRRTIQSALSFCEGGKAGCWAANYLKQINTSMTNENAAFPFEGKWETFEKQFKVCFGSANEKADAIRELEQMKQGNKAVVLKR